MPMKLSAPTAALSKVVSSSVLCAHQGNMLLQTPTFVVLLVLQITTDLKEMKQSVRDVQAITIRPYLRSRFASKRLLADLECTTGAKVTHMLTAHHPIRKCGVSITFCAS
jgi:hypothetical protein